MCGRPLQRVIYKYRNISSDVDSYIVGGKWWGCYVTWFLGPLTPLQRPPNLFLQFKKYIRTTHCSQICVGGFGYPREGSYIYGVK
jgi:hypothetical protein